jgi:hypothetical protein
MTTPANPRAALRMSLAGDDAQTHLTLAWRPASPFYKVELVEIEEDVSNTFLTYARGAADTLAAGVEIPYDPEWPLKDHEYFSLPRVDLPGSNLFDDLEDFQNLDRFMKKRLTKPRLYVVAVQTPAGNAFFGKRMAYLKVLAQKRDAFAAVWDGSTFNVLTNSVATFSPDFDWALWDDILYILDGAGFHAEFRDSKALKEAVEEHVTTITQTLPIKNVDQLIERCRSNVQMASKLKRIAERGLQTEPVDRLKQYATDYAIPVAWEEDVLVFDGTFEGQWSILKLLDEDRTEGPVSHRKYESAAKREV